MEATLSPSTQWGYLRKYASFIDTVFLKTEIKEELTNSLKSLPRAYLKWAMAATFQ